MLINSQGVQVQVAPNIHGHTVKGAPNRDAIAVLAPLREVLEPTTTKCGDMFKFGTRARSNL